MHMRERILNLSSRTHNTAHMSVLGKSNVNEKVNNEPKKEARQKVNLENTYGTETRLMGLNKNDKIIGKSVKK